MLESASEKMAMNLRTVSLTAGLLLLTLVPCACNDEPPDPNAPFKAAINAYWRVHPLCLWTQAVKMPTNEFSNTTERSAEYEALVGVGLLQRTQSQKKTPAGMKQINDYDLTDQGRESWVPVKTSKGYGDLCYGHRSVDTVDSATETEAKWNASMPATTIVVFHYLLKDQAPWATNPALQTAFPAMAAVLNGPHADTATLLKTSSGWVMTEPRVSVKAAAAARAAAAAGAAAPLQP